MSGLLVWIVIWRPQNTGVALLSLPFHPGFLLRHRLAARDADRVLRHAFSRSAAISRHRVAGSLVRLARFLRAEAVSERRRRLSSWTGIPIYYLLQIVRAPLIDGVLPSVTTWLCLIACVSLAGFWAINQARTSERSLVLYL
jgi:hypothetical protein